MRNPCARWLIAESPRSNLLSHLADSTYTNLGLGYCAPRILACKVGGNGTEVCLFSPNSHPKGALSQHGKSTD
jgi:hypothetical protein